MTPIHDESYPLELLGQARAALTTWYSKKGLKGPELEEKVSRVMRTQFGISMAIDAALDEAFQAKRGSK
jgi:hypothetical protein